VWVNVGWDGPVPTVNLSGSYSWTAATAASTAASRRLLSGPQDCSARIKRFDVLGSQDMQHGPDPMFEASRHSISSHHDNCGDSAQGIHEACSKFNHWATFKEVAHRHGTPFMVFGPKKVEYHDIGQGQLGTCYFLAAVASVAYSDPQVIDNMFVDRDKWDHNIYTTRWLLNGKVMLVEVDDMIPAHNGRPFFVQPSHEGEFWPIILEKTWSKIFTSFKAAEGGFWDNVVSAMTRAPTRRYHHSDVPQEKIWDILTDGTARKFPMAAGAGSGAANFGMVSDHAYSVFRAYHSHDYGDVVQVFNPWHRDHYKGAVPNHDHTDGSFTMTFAEYYQAFDTTSIAAFRPHYVNSFRVIQRESQSKASVLEFEVPDDDVFYVSLNWPSQRMVKPCQMKDPKVTLAVAKLEAGELGEPVLGDQPSYGINSASARVALGAGRYVAFASADFPDGDFIDQIVLTVYAPAKVTIDLTNQSAPDVGITMFGPAGGERCDQVMIDGRGLFTKRLDRTYGGIPTYWSLDGKMFAYFVANSSSAKWSVVTQEYWARVQKGEVWHVAQIPRTDLSCGCSDSHGGVAGFLDVSCTDVKEPYPKYSNVKCTGEYATHVQRYCPDTCGPLDVCSSSSAPPAGPEEEPTPTGTTPALRIVCQDHEQTGITVNDGQSAATCDELRSYCFMSEAVQSKCCKTCEREAEQAEITNGGDAGGGECHDDVSFRFTVNGQELGCGQAGNYCEDHDSVRELCCGTCKQQLEDSINEMCFDDPNPGIIAQTTGANTSCPNLHDFCFMETVQDTCCKTCEGAAS
jgi:hypothetical protein